MNSNKIKLILYDFDGIMTDNKVIIDQFGNESVIVNRSDGLAIAEIKKLNIKQMIISTEVNAVVKKRAEKLNIPIINAVKNKKKIVERLLIELGIDKKNVIFVGNDLNDLEAMKFVGYAVCPCDAHKSVKQIAKKITKAKGGDGVIRELLDILLKEN